VKSPTLDTWETGAHPRKGVLLLGLGKDILSDDAVGLYVAREIRQRLSDLDGVEVHETIEMGLSLLDYIVDFETVFLVDAVQTGRVPPGHLHEFDCDDLKILPTKSPHCLGVGEVLALGRELGMAVPSQVRIFAVEVQDPFTIGTELTPAVRRAMPSLVRQVIQGLWKIGQRVAKERSRQPECLCP
jgi:hydrogenase maturation protease